MLFQLPGLFGALRARQRRAGFSMNYETLESRIVLATDVLTYHMDIASTGVNATETDLTPANVVVNSFGKLLTVPVDGQVYAEPLVQTGVTIAAGPHTSPGAAGLHDVVFVATQHDTLYAIDSSANGSVILWQRSFLDLNIAANNTLGASTITSIPSADIGTADIDPEVGITGTPVIDQATGVMYLVVKTRETISGVDHYVQRLHAINVADGTDRVSPYLIGDTVGNNTNQTAIFVYGTGDGAVPDSYHGTNKTVVQFNALREHQRGALSLVNGTVYVEWASHGDNGPYHGLVATWDVSHLGTNGMVLSGVLNVSPNDGLSGIWQSGGRLVFEPNGSAFYFETGNGSGGAPHLNGAGFPNDGNYNEALVKVVRDPASDDAHQNINGWGLKVADYFIPYNVNALDGADSDFGSGAPIILPDSAGIPGHPHLMVAGGKEGKLYLIDRDQMGHYDGSNDHVLNAIPDGSGHNTAPGAISGLLSTPVWFNDSLYVVSGYNWRAHAFTIDDSGTLTQTSQTTNANFGYLPGSPTVSANGTSNGIVWLLDRNANMLRAYDAATLATELWNSNQKVGGGDSLGAVIKFAVPTVANGRVFVGTSNALVVYGLLQPPDTAPQPSTLAAASLSGTAARLTWSDPSIAPNTAHSYLIEQSSDGTNFTEVATAPAGAVSLAVGGLQPLTHYYFRITGKNSQGNSLPSNVADVTTTDETALLDFSGGFAGAQQQLQFNGKAILNGSRLQLTDTEETYEAASVFSRDRVDVTAFATEFTFQIEPGTDIADGFTFTIQGVGPTAIGLPGGELAYATIGSSIAIKFDLYDNTGEGTSSTGLFTNGDVPFSVGSIELAPSGIDLHSGHPFHVAMSYDGQTLFVTITDTQTEAAASQSYTVNIPQFVGGNSAYVGFTGATGGLSAVQSLSDWTYTPTATTSPNAPSGLGATPAGPTAVRLAWTNNATNQLGYHLDRALDADFTQSLVTQSLPSFLPTYVDQAIGLNPGGTYFYRLRAFNSVGDSDNSNTVQVTIPLAPPKPSNQQIEDVTDNSIALSWQDNAGHQADGYRILRATNHGTFISVATLPPTSRTAPSTYEWTDEDVDPGTFYEYHILAFNVSGNNDFAGVNATTLTLAPQNVVADAGALTVELTWDAAPGAQTYNVYRGLLASGDDAVLLTSELTDPHFADLAVTAGVTYYYRVTAVNANIDHDPILPAESDPSPVIAATPTNLPGVPRDVVITTGLNRMTPQVVLNWTAPAGGATSFNVYRSTSPLSEGGTPLVTGLATTTYTDTSAQFGTTYYYRVSAVNAAGEGPASTARMITPVVDVRINFTSTSGDPVPEFLSDTGLELGARSNGLTYGWNREDTLNGVDLDSPNSPDEIRDSFHRMKASKGPKHSWSILLPNGTYTVHIVAGDRSDTSSPYRISLTQTARGKVKVIDGQSSVGHPWLENTVTVTVKKGVLSVRGSGPGQNKIDAITITGVQPQTAAPRSGHKH